METANHGKMETRKLIDPGLLLHKDLTDKILKCAVTIHTAVGPGLKEQSYQTATSLEMTAAGLKFVRERSLSVIYRGVVIGCHRPDFIVEDSVVVEVKSTLGFESVFEKQVLGYLRVSGLRIGLLINFNSPNLAYGGIRRLAL